jgi:hypothetical protein
MCGPSKDTIAKAGTKALQVFTFSRYNFILGNYAYFKIGCANHLIKQLKLQ